MAPNDGHTTSAGHKNDRLSRAGLEIDGPPMGLVEDSAHMYTRDSKWTPPSKILKDPPSPSAKSVNKKKKKKKKKTSEKYPSTNSSQDDSYKEAEEKAANFVKSCGFTEVEVDKARQELRRQGVQVTTDSLLDKVYDVRDGLIELSITSSMEAGAKPKLQTDGASLGAYGDSYSGDSEESDGEDSDSSSSGDGGIIKPDINLAYRKAVEREKSKYRDMIDDLRIMCRMCNCSPATILLLPCGHLVCCDDCLMDVRRCPINRCNKVVRGTKEVFFA